MIRELAAELADAVSTRAELEALKEEYVRYAKLRDEEVAVLRAMKRPDVCENCLKVALKLETMRNAVKRAVEE